MDAKKRHIVTAVVIVVVLLLLFSKGLFRPVELDSGYRPVMGTFARIVVVADNLKIARESIKSAFLEIDTVDMLMSDYKEDSEISLINKNAFKESVKVTKPTFEVLQKAVEFSELSEGAFDITIGPLVDLWRSAADANSLPTEDEISHARSKVGYEKLILDPVGNTVRFKAEGMRIDLGGIAKGYAVDRGMNMLQQAGVTTALVSAGGDTRVSGKRWDRPWHIGIRNPRDEGSIVSMVPLENSAISTSGDYERYFVEDGVRYHHILDPKLLHFHHQELKGSEEIWLH